MSGLQPVKRFLAAVALCGTMAVTMLPTPSIAASETITYTGQTTSTNCINGRICLNKKTVNSCGGSSNNCFHFNANGGSFDHAWSNVGRSNAERAYNRNTGSYRDVCAYKRTGLDWNSGAARAYYGGGWTILPFTGVGSMEAINQTWLCNYQ